MSEDQNFDGTIKIDPGPKEEDLEYLYALQPSEGKNAAIKMFIKYVIPAQFDKLSATFSRFLYYRHPGGRPKKYKNREEFTGAIQEHFKSFTRYQIMRMNPAGLSVMLSISKKTLDRYTKKFNFSSFDDLKAQIYQTRENR